MSEKLWHWVDVPLGDIYGVVVLVHGIGEHSKRFEELVSWLVMHEYAVLGYDQYGHGKSPGKRGAIDTETRLTDDLRAMINEAKKQFAGLPLYLVGHSMGGLVALDYAQAHPDEITGVVALSPALDFDISPFKRLFQPLLLRIAPDWALGNGLPVSGISRNREVIAAYRQDPLVHDKITPRLAQYVLTASERVRGKTQVWPVPTLLLYAGADQLVNPQGSADFAAQAPQDVVTAQCFDDAYHELHHEPDTTAFYQALQNWLPSKHHK